VGGRDSGPVAPDSAQNLPAGDGYDQHVDSESISPLLLDGMAFALCPAMGPTPATGGLPSRRGRRTLTALLLLLLILLPLYLWPLRAGLGGLPGAAALAGFPKDPRNPGAVATIPRDVWDALMGQDDDGPRIPPKAPPKPRNLTMITEVTPNGGANGFGSDAGGAPSWLLQGLPAGPTFLADVTDPTAGGGSGKSDGDGSSSTPDQPPGSSNGGQNTWAGWYGGGFPGSPGLGPSGNGGGAHFTSPIVSFEVGDPGAPQPTPEPATIALVSVNAVLLALILWKRRVREQETTPTG